MSSPAVSDKRLGLAPTGAGRRVRWRSLVVTVALVVVAGILFAGLFTAIGSQSNDALGWDFRATYYPAGEAVLEGSSPYPHDAGGAFDERAVYAYPPPLAFVVAPFTALPIDAAAVLAMLASFAALMGAIALVGVRDIRCFAALVIWAPGWNALETVNVSAFLALLLALAWRFRAVPWALASALGLIVSIKLFLWPLFVWAVFTRRAAAAVLGGAIALGLSIGTWAVIGFAGLRAYPDLLHRVASQESYSLERIGIAVGLSPRGSYVATFIVSGLLVLLSVIWAGRGDEPRSLLAAVAAALAGTPVLWLHYLVLLAVPLALFRPRFSALWLLPIALWICPRADVTDNVTLFVPAVVVVMFVFALLRRPASGDSARAERLGTAGMA
jgi:hypothetical protein